MNRKEAWKDASELVEPIVERHGFKPIQVGSFLAPSSVSSPVDQHIGHILTVADWLLENAETIN